MLSHQFAVLSLGFSLGMMHAFDADHVLAVSTLSHAKRNVHKVFSYCMTWALGHASVLMASGGVLFAIGIQLPGFLQQAAEAAVGLLLIVLGLLCFKQQYLYRPKGKSTSAWWNPLNRVFPEPRHIDQYSENRQHTTPLMVGVLHGLAGSASTLAVIPALAQGDAALGMVYLMLFSLGVMLSMLLFGLSFGRLQQYLQCHHWYWFQCNRLLIAAGSVIMGVYWLYQVF